MSHSTVLRPPSVAETPFASHSVLSRSWAIPGIGPVPTAGPRPVARVINLPPLSETVARAAALAGDPNASLIDFADLVRGDPALTAMLLKRVNSAAIGAATTDVRQAVTLLGLRTCSQLVASVGMRDLLRNAPPAVADRCEAILRHSLLTAHLASQLNRLAGVARRGEEFVAGLLHDVGRVLLAMTRPEEIEAGDPLDYTEGPDRPAHERAILGTDHCTVGAEFASTSKLPPAVVRVVLKHHAPFDDGGEYRPVTALVSVADHLANHIQRTRRVADYEPWSGFGYAVLAERWDGDKHDALRAALPSAVKAALRGTRAALRAAPR